MGRNIAYSILIVFSEEEDLGYLMGVVNLVESHKFRLL